jgi:hypothetical protein
MCGHSWTTVLLKGQLSAKERTPRNTCEAFHKISGLLKLSTIKVENFSKEQEIVVSKDKYINIGYINI